ncbi:MAG TPA: ABC transporter permease [Chryseosolibacter sp.]
MMATLFQGLFRSVMRNKLLTTLNLAGLGLGFSSCILIVLFLFDQLGYDRHHSNLDRIYRLSTKFVSAGTVDDIAICASPLPEALKESFPEVAESIRVNSKGGGVSIKRSDGIFVEDNIYAADPGIFRIFSYPFISGDPATALTHSSSVVLTKSLAKKYFPNGDALGSVLKIENTDHQVTAVIEDVPRNSEIYFSMLLPLDTAHHKDWFDFSHYVFVMFDKKAMADPSLISRFQKKLDKLTNDHINGPMQAENPTLSASMSLQPLKGLHFDNSLKYDTPKGKKDYVYIFVSVALLILSIACINYINFSVVQSMEKSREVGIRKVVGSSFWQLVFRYIAQSTALTLFALVLSVGIVYLLLPQFNEVVGRDFRLQDLLRSEIVITMGVIMIVTGVLAGSYPAFYSSSLNVVSSLKGVLTTPAGKSIRKISITIQFAVTLGLLICTIIIYSQMTFIKNYNLGFQKEKVVAVRTPEDSVHYQKIISFRNEVSQMHDLIESIAIAGDGGTPGDPEDEQRGSHALKNGDGKEAVYMINTTYIDHTYMDVLGIQMKLGRNYNDSPNDKENSIIINQALVNILGWKDPLSQTIRWGSRERNVIGVVGDIHYKSLYNPVEPQFFVPHQKRIVNVFIRLHGAGSENIEKIQRTWSAYFPDEPFRYSFLDDTLEKQYRQEKTATNILTYFSILTILISIFGMFGLSLLSAYQRKREIGIRKVIGAEFRDIAMLFSKEYAVFLIIAMALISPIVWYMMDEWLHSFVTHAPINIYIFIFVGISFAIVALFSILLSIGKITGQKSIELIK